MEHYGILTLLPPLLAILLSFATTLIVPALVAGIYIGALVISGWNPLTGITYTLQVILENFTDPGNASLILFTLFMGVGISFIWRLGGSFAMQRKAKATFKTRRSVCLGTWVLGMLTSVNDCLVAAVDGNVFRDVCKEYRISSEKFSYVLDSTAAPAAALFISDWIAYQIGMIGKGLNIAGITSVKPVGAYIRSIPFNLYSIFTLIFVGLLMFRGKDYGSMLKAELRALTTGEFTREGAKPMLDVGHDLGEPKLSNPQIYTFVLPIFSAVAVILFGIFWTGRGGGNLMGILEQADASAALLWGSFTMALVGVLCALFSRIMSFKEAMDTVIDGFKLMTLTATILVLAWSLGGITKTMGLSAYILEVIGTDFPIGLLMIVVCLIAMLVSFATGTSWGTMGIVTPVAVPLAYQLTGDVGMACAIAGVVLSGAIFGDHCSPISDTTVMASIFSGADHIDHVRTQIPYSLTVAAVMLPLFGLHGYLGLSPIILIPTGLVILFVLQSVLHKLSLKRYGISADYHQHMKREIESL